MLFFFIRIEYVSGKKCSQRKHREEADRPGIEGGRQDAGDDTTLSKNHTQTRPEETLQAPLAGGIDHPRYQDHAGHGNPELQDAANERKGDVGLSAGLQPDPSDHVAIGIAGRCVAALIEFQAHTATLVGMERNIDSL